jgi:hypothetical protein
VATAGAAPSLSELEEVLLAAIKTLQPGYFII